MMRCGKLHSKRDFLKKRSELVADTGQTLYLGVQYYVIYWDHIDNVSLEHIRAQHKSINDDFAKENQDIIKVPSTTLYPFTNVVGTANINLLPSVLEEENIIRIRSSAIPSQGFDDISNVIQFINLYTSMHVPLNGVMNIYICPLSSRLLGQAYLFSNQCMVDTGTVGSRSLLGSHPRGEYAGGRSATHELGHSYGLPHTFQENCKSDFADIPVQKNPNYTAVLEEVDGQWTGRLDNRFRDCHSPDYDNLPISRPYSCQQDYSCGLGPYEMFMNFMDYGSDSIMIMFTIDQISAMRKFVLESSTFTIYDVPSVLPLQDQPIVFDNPYTMSIEMTVSIVTAIITLVVIIIAIVLAIH